MVPFKRRETGTESSCSDRGYNREVINVKLDCSLKMFQLLVSKLTDSTNESKSQSTSDEIQFFPSRLTISHPAYSVPPFHVRFSKF